MEMEFEVNNQKWNLYVLPKTEFENISKERHEAMNGKIEENNYILGFCDNCKHEIFINSYQCKDEMIRTVTHEFIHCWLWANGASYTSYIEDALCDTVSSSYDWLHTVVEKFKETYCE